MTKKLTISALLVALAMILSYVEVLIPFNFGIPGIKLGLANLVVVVALYLLNARQALMISVVRILLVSFTFGNMAALLYSITGGLLSFAVMVLCRRIKGLSTMSVSVAGGISHNIGQILVAVFVVKNLNLLFYLPVLMIAGIITGLLIGLVAGLIIPFDVDADGDMMIDDILISLSEEEDFEQSFTAGKTTYLVQGKKED